jgi:GT2 family glycosyltransferase
LSATTHEPEVAVAVASHDRPLRLRWLLNALAEQTLAPERWVVVVGHDSAGPETDELLLTHLLAQSGRLHSVRSAPGTMSPGANRNAAWRSTRAPVIVFTDDDCRPPAEWLELALTAAQRHPGAVIQGATAPDPEEATIGQHASWIHTQSIWPPQRWAQACNIIYPRDVLEAVGGFPEHPHWGEDTILAERARDAGAPYVAAPEVVTWHAIVETSVVNLVRGAWRWRDLPLMIRRAPRLREHVHLYIFWKREHPLLLLAALGWWGMRRTRLAVILTLPYIAHATPKKHGQHPRARLRAASELPGWTAIYIAEMASLASGSIKHRTLFL